MRRILVVDDEPDARELLTEFLTARGYAVLAASSGEEALCKVREERPDLILLDVCMPRMNGLEVLKRVREIDHDVGVIMVTAISEAETGRQALKLGAFDYITKPLDFEYLERSLRELGGAPRMDTILVVEDDPRSADLLKEFLKDEAHPVIVARTGAEGRTILQETPVCLVLLDLVLPDMNGFDLLQDAQRLDTPPDVIVITGHASLDSAIKAIEAGAAGYILKPVAAASLRTLVRKVTERRRLQRENTALTERLDCERRQLEVLYDVSRRLISVRNTDEILSLIVNEASRLLSAEAVGLRLLEGEEFVLRAYTGSAASLTARSRVRAGASVSGLVAAEGGPVAIEDLLEDTRYDQANTRGVASQGFRGFLGVPLKVLGELIGVLNVYTKSRRHFTADETSLLSALADQASLALEKARLLEATERAARETRSLYELSHTLATSLDPMEVLNLISAKTTELLGTPHAQVVLWDEDTKALRLGAAYGTHAEQVKQQQFLLGEGVNGVVAETRAPLIVNDYQAYAKRVSGMTELVAVIGVPLLYRGRLLGILSSHATKPGSAFTEDHLALLTSFANQATVAIENARLYEAAERRRIQLAQLVEAAVEGIYKTTPDGQILAVNPALARILGYECPEELLASMAHPAQAYLDPARRAEFIQRITAEGVVVDFESEVRRRDGSRIWIAENARVVRGADGAMTHYEGFVQDITLRKQADQMKSDFVSFATHQLRTPLAGIKWLLELAAQDSDLSAETRSYIQDAQASNERLVRLVNDLLDVSRLERGKIAIAPQDILLEEMTRSVLNDLTPLISERGHRVSIIAAKEVLPVWADPQLLRQVILNLASNAVKYTPPGGTIAVRMRTVMGAEGQEEAGGRQEAADAEERADDAVSLPTAACGLPPGTPKSEIANRKWWSGRSRTTGSGSQRRASATCLKSSTVQRTS